MIYLQRKYIVMLMALGKETDMIQSFLGRKCTTGEFTPTSGTWKGTITHEDVGTPYMILTVATDLNNTSSLQKIGDIYISAEASGLTDIAGTKQLTYANGNLTMVTRNTYRMYNITNTSFTVLADTTYGWKPNVKYSYLVVGDLLD